MTRRIGTCVRCLRPDRRIVTRGLDSTCYDAERAAGRLDNWPFMMRANVAVHTPPPEPDPRPDAPVGTNCEWCGVPLTRSRKPGDSRPLYEVYTVAGRMAAFCFENCPAELTEVS